MEISHGWFIIWWVVSDGFFQFLEKPMEISHELFRSTM